LLGGGWGESGAGVYGRASTPIINCAIARNATGAGAYAEIGGNGGDGAGVYCSSSASTTNCTITTNTTGAAGSGIFPGRRGIVGTRYRRNYSATSSIHLDAMTEFYALAENG
jgi:hypothetical protein